jgi:hypothetical protein
VLRRVVFVAGRALPVVVPLLAGVIAVVLLHFILLGPVLRHVSSLMIGVLASVARS